MKIYKYSLFSLVCLTLFSCGEAFLDVKPSIRQRVPTSLRDYQLMLNHSTFYEFTPLILNYVGSDELYVPSGLFNSMPVSLSYNFLKNAYTWQKEIYEGAETSTDWNGAYSRILTANIIIEGLHKLSNRNIEWDKALGEAVFNRVLNYYHLAQTYCLPYDKNKVKDNLGLPLRVESDLTMKVSRSSLEETYSFILKEVKNAIELLPLEAESSFKPSKLAGYALLSRIYLQMTDYSLAEEYASKVLSKRNILIDYNLLQSNNNFSFPAYGKGNVEVILYRTLVKGNVFLRSYYSKVDTNLLSCYESNDLRRKIYFDVSDPLQGVFIGSFSGSEDFFTGFSNSELFLNRAESYARLGNSGKALEDLNYLRKNRIIKDDFLPLESSDNQEVLNWIIEERVRELVLRGTRWEDLRRLNQEPVFEKTLVREIGDLRYVLFPNDKRYVWPLPLEAILIGDYTRNER